MMGMDHAGHECCWGGAQGVVGGPHLLRSRRDRKRRHLVRLRTHRLPTLVSTRVEQKGLVCIWHVLDLWWHVRCKTTPAGQTQ